MKIRMAFDNSLRMMSDSSFMMKVPTDIGPIQEEFEDMVCGFFDDPDGEYEILDRNIYHDPFEPDIEVMDSDEWVFSILCYYEEEYPTDGVVEIFPKTFGMRKWVTDTQERPAFLAMGVGGTPSNPDLVYFARFYNFNDRFFLISEGKELQVNWLKPEFFHKVIREEMDRLFSPI